MNNRLSNRQQDNYLNFLNDQTPQSNSLMANIFLIQNNSREQLVKIQIGQSMDKEQGGYQWAQSKDQYVQDFNGQQLSYKRLHHKTNQAIRNYQIGPLYQSSLYQSSGLNKAQKSKKKVFYRDKMAQLMSQQNYVKSQYNYIDIGQLQKGKSPISRDEQLKRNRQSAKQSRLRKKQYVQTLQQKARLYQKQVNQLSQRLRQTQLQRDRLKQSNTSQIQSFIQQKNVLYSKLADILGEEKQVQGRRNRMQQVVTEMRNRFGSNGKERVGLVNYYMCEIIQNLLTDFQKYFINCAIAGKGIFGQRQNQSRIDSEIVQLLGLNQSKKSSLVSKYKQRFKRQALHFNSICQQLYQSFSGLINQSSKIQTIVNDVSKQFQGQQIVALLLYFQENKFRKDHRKMKNQWYENFRRNQEDFVDPLRKIKKGNQ